MNLFKQTTTALCCMLIALLTYSVDINAQIIANGTYNIRATNTGQNLSSTGNSAIVMANRNDNSNSQQWEFRHLGDNVYDIRNVRTGRFLTQQTGCSNGTTVTTNTSPFSPNSKWIATRSGGNFFFRTTLCSNHALDKRGGRNGRPHMWAFSTGNSNERFQIRRVTSGGGSTACSFTRLNGLALDIGSGGGQTYVVGTNRRVYRRAGNGWQIQPGGVQAARIDVTGAGVPWIVATDGRIYFLSGNSWRRVSGAASDVGCSGNTIAVVGNGGIIYRRQGNSWQALNSSRRGVRIDVRNDGNPWITGTDGFVYQHSNGNWSRKGNLRTRDLSFAEGRGDLWALSSSGRVHFYRGNNVWVQQTGTANHISVGDNRTVWVVNSNRNIFSGNCNSALRVESADELAISIAPNPAQYQLQLDLVNYMDEQINYFISNMAGQIVATGQYNQNHSATEIVDISNLQNGHYVISLQLSEGRKAAKKFVVIK